jgi:hypothetical protein
MLAGLVLVNCLAASALLPRAAPRLCALALLAFTGDVAATL